MKRLFAAIAILSITIAMCIMAFSFLGKTCKNISDELNIIKEYINEEKTDLALSKLNSVSKKWNQNKKILKMFVDHSYIIEIDVAFSQLGASLAGSNDSSECLPILDEIVTRASLLKNSEKLSLENIF